MFNPEIIQNNFVNATITTKQPMFATMCALAKIFVRTRIRSLPRKSERFPTLDCGFKRLRLKSHGSEKIYKIAVHL